ncbi:MAG: DUF58 domain-containing protein [Clostridiales bacterium]|jgi:hypothetical protein|nr:DUF58 domain-containing protein [Clostridiales bacterium]
MACVYLAGCLVGGLATGFQEFFLVAALLALVLIAAFIQSFFLRPHYHLEPSWSSTTRCQTATIYLNINNPFAIPLIGFDICCQLQRPGQIAAPLFQESITLAAGKRQRLPIQILCPHRGEYQAGFPKIHSRDIFGFFSLPCPSAPSVTILSLPRLDLGNSEGTDLAINEDEESRINRRGAGGQLVAESRLYLQGDALRSINWKKSLSRQEFFTRYREQPANPACLLLLDTRPCAEGEAELEFEDRICEEAIRLLFSQLCQGRALTLLPGDLHLQNPEELHKAAELLATVDFTREEVFTALSELTNQPISPDVLFLLLGQDLDQEMKALVEHLESQSCHIVEVRI